ncbi:hypothetical protein CO015_05610 [candidate division WWE3 bacterium CG_4_8_14_3_um_filter_42_11]|uniref:Fido domain-containing protein n=1 Tax=candidate division WWE3 bacterium CG_4_8_14_3_um_filter_42_11 TaxID=1975076 RepID=A0A2M8G5A3_UNCKA|nr:MAG: hypothetical protein CO015_05610 [candidate division WWE3 bacterium CG_4_8_14_3_um_filter_42_11]
MFSPKYTISNTILNNLTAIAEIRAIVGRSKVLPERETLLRRQAIEKMVHASVSIEGNLLAEFEVEKVLAGQKIRAGEKQILEVKNYEKALKKVWELAEVKNEITRADVLAVHKITTQDLVAKEKCGQFRLGPVYVANIDKLKNKEEIVYTAPVAQKVPVLIQDLLDWLSSQNKQNINRVIIAGLLHYQFVTIHPFSDGNGRLTRLLTHLYLAQHNFAFKHILVLEAYYNNDRKSYYQALDTGDNFEMRRKADLTFWLEYFTTGFLKEAEKVKQEILSMGFARSFPDGEQIFLDRGQIKIMDFIASMGKITSQDVMDILGIPKRTAQSKLRKLVENKIISKKGDGPSTFYTLKQSA